MYSGTQEMAQLFRRLSHKHKTWIRIPGTHVESQDAFPSGLSAEEAEAVWSARTLWPASLVESVSLNFSERHFLKN